MTHSGYLDNFTSTNSDANVKKLQNNIKKWVTKSTTPTNSMFTDTDSYIKLTTTSTFKALYTTEYRGIYTATDKSKILNFVKNGGGLIVSATPWGWMQLKGTSDLTLMLTYNTLLAANLLYTGDIIWGSSTFTAVNANTQLSNVYTQLLNALKAKSSTVNYQLTKNVAKSTRYLPIS